MNKTIREILDDTYKIGRTDVTLGSNDYETLKPGIYKAAQQEINKAVKEMSVGKTKDAQKASKVFPPKTKSEAFMNGWRYARNQLQENKKRYLRPNRELQKGNSNDSK